MSEAPPVTREQARDAVVAAARQLREWERTPLSFTNLMPLLDALALLDAVENDGE